MGWGGRGGSRGAVRLQWWFVKSAVELGGGSLQPPLPTQAVFPIAPLCLCWGGCIPLLPEVEGFPTPPLLLPKEGQCDPLTLGGFLRAHSHPRRGVSVASSCSLGSLRPSPTHVGFSTAPSHPYSLRHHPLSPKRGSLWSPLSCEGSLQPSPTQGGALCDPLFLTGGLYSPLLPIRGGLCDSLFLEGGVSTAPSHPQVFPPAPSSPRRPTVSPPPFSPQPLSQPSGTPGAPPTCSAASAPRVGSTGRNTGG